MGRPGVEGKPDLSHIVDKEKEKAGIDAAKKRTSNYWENSLSESALEEIWGDDATDEK